MKQTKISKYEGNTTKKNGNQLKHFITCFRNFVLHPKNIFCYSEYKHGQVENRCAIDFVSFPQEKTPGNP